MLSSFISMIEDVSSQRKGSLVGFSPAYPLPQYHPCMAQLYCSYKNNNNN